MENIKPTLEVIASVPGIKNYSPSEKGFVYFLGKALGVFSTKSEYPNN